VHGFVLGLTLREMFSPGRCAQEQVAAGSPTRQPWSSDHDSQLGAGAHHIFARLQLEVAAEAKRGGEPNLLRMLSVLARMSLAERVRSAEMYRAWAQAEASGGLRESLQTGLSTPQEPSQPPSKASRRSLSSSDGKAQPLPAARALAKLGTPEVRAEAVRAALAFSQDNIENQAALVQGGGVGVLVRLAKEATTTVEVHSTIAQIFGTLAKSSSAYAAAIVEEGGVVALVSLIQDTSSVSCGYSLFALTHLASCSNDNKHVLEQAGAIPALVNLLQQGRNELHGYVAGLQYTLVDGITQNQATLVASGGVPALLALAAAGPRDASERAARALAVLALNSAEARDSITREGGVRVLARLVHDRECRYAAATLRQLPAPALSALSPTSSAMVSTV